MTKMYDPDERDRLRKRQRVIDAWEEKYGEPVPRVVASYLLESAPDEIVARFAENPGPHIPPQDVGPALETSGMGWERVIGWDDSPEFAGDPESLAVKMIRLYAAAFQKVHGRKPSPAELECVLAVGRGESMWGTAKYPGGLGPGMHNHGAVQCHKNCTDENSFQSWDTHPLDSGGSKKYDQRFRRYKNDEEGIEHLIKLVGKDPLRMLDDNHNLVAAFSLGMFGNRYYEMFNAPVETINKNRAVFDWIRTNAGKPPSGTSKSFREALARAQDPIWAGRVLMHSLAIGRHIEATAKAVGSTPHVRFTPAAGGIGVDALVGGGAGALVGMVTFGPIGAGIGAAVGAAGGMLVERLRSGGGPPQPKTKKVEDVAELQKRINAAGYQPPLKVDGKRGPKTDAGERWLAQKESKR